jgi:hypothetical protein
VTDLNNGAESLGFCIHDHTYNAHMIDLVSGGKKKVSKEDFAAVVSSVNSALQLPIYSSVNWIGDSRTAISWRHLE